MTSKPLLLLLLTLYIVLSGCGDNAQAQTPDESGLTSCTGFGAADINIFVKDSLNEDLLISGATVRVITDAGTESLEETATYIESEDNFENTLTDAYYSELNLNANEYEIHIVVFADGYHSAVTKGINFELNTSCGASNSIVQTVYICPTGTPCL